MLHPQKRGVGKARGPPSRKLRTLGSYPLGDNLRLGFVYNSEVAIRERAKGVTVEKQGEELKPWILSLLYFTARSRLVAATGHRLKDLR